MKKLLILLVCFLISGVTTFAQFAINNDDSDPHNSAMLDVKSSNKGVLIPRMTYVERDAIQNPADGLMVYCIDCGVNGSLSIFSNGMWRTFSPCSNTVPQEGTHVPDNTSIVWNWIAVPDALGYKWGVTNQYSAATDMGQATSTTENNLICGNQYARFVWAYNSCGFSAPVQMTQATLGTISSPTPGIIVPYFTSITWKWNAVTGAVGYKWNTVDNFETALDMGANTAYNETNMACGSSFDRYVWAYNSCGVSPSLKLTGNTLPAPGAPYPGNPTSTCSSISWNWTPVPNAAGYKWNTVNEFTTATDMGTATSYTEDNLTYNNSYTRYVWAYNQCGPSGSVTLNGSTLSGPPTPLAANHVATFTTIKWNWHPVTNPGVTYKWNTTSEYTTAISVSTDTTYTEGGLACGNAYTRYVWAVNSCGPSAPVILNFSTSNCPVCGDPITVNHIATTGGPAPVDKTVTYGTITGIAGESTKCWITRNLGASTQATSATDATESSAGWYWQFNRKQGFKHDGTTRTPATTWITTINENLNWTSENDPCSIEIGLGYRIVTRAEWTNVDASTGSNWTNATGPYTSLWMHAAGNLAYNTGNVQYRGSSGYYWSSTQHTSTYSNAYYLTFTTSACLVSSTAKATGHSVRCIKD